MTNNLFELGFCSRWLLLYRRLAQQCGVCSSSPWGASPVLAVPLACGAFLCLIAEKDYSIFYSSFRILIKIITL